MKTGFPDHEESVNLE